ncbi:MAG TPA: EamA family transporter [Nanoarchaeota archaeon]|nr:EamA family transporter [Nanoarchaeota archaeon]
MEKEKAKSTVTILGSVTAVAAGELLLKQGLIKLGPLDFAANAASSFISIFTSPYILLGIVLFAASSLLWLIAISKTELSYAYPLMGIGYAVVAFFSWLLFNEALTALRILGIFVIMAGVVMMARS